MKLPKIEEIHLADLKIDIALSGRTEKEIAANAKALAPMLKSTDGWSPNQPGQYFVRNDEKHLAAGFTRAEAARSLGMTGGYFVQVPDDRQTLRTACITSNAGRPVSAYEQGRVFAAMRDGDDVETLEAGQTALDAMTLSKSPTQSASLPFTSTIKLQFSSRHPKSRSL